MAKKKQVQVPATMAGVTTTAPSQPPAAPITLNTPNLVKAAPMPVAPKTAAKTSGWKNTGTQLEPNWVPAGPNAGLSPMGRMGGTVQVPTGQPQLTQAGLSPSEQFYASEAAQHLKNITDFQKTQAEGGPEAQAQRLAEAAQIGQNLPQGTPIPGESRLSGPLTAAAVGGAAIAGVQGGAMLGALGGPLAPVTVPVGAALGGLVGAVGALIGKGKIVRGGLVRQAAVQASESEKDLVLSLKAANAGVPTEQVEKLYEQAWADIYESQIFLTRESNRSLDAFTGNAGDDLLTVNNLIARKAIWDMRVQQAIIKPNPNDIMTADMVEYMENLNA